MGSSASVIMRANVSPSVENLLKTQYKALKKEGKCEDEEIGKALLATLHDLKKKQEEEQRKAGIIDEDAETRYYTDTLISYGNGATYYGQLKQKRYLVYNKKAGKFVDSKKHKHPMIREGDYGVMKFSNGDVYEGSWKNDMMHGKGVMKWKSGNVYEGPFVKNMMTTAQDPKTRQPIDTGKLILFNGDVYQGEFKCNMFEGQGLYRRADGAVDHEGIWYRDKPHTGPHKRIRIHYGHIVKEICDCKEHLYDHIDTEFHPRKEDDDCIGNYKDILITRCLPSDFLSDQAVSLLLSIH